MKLSIFLKDHKKGQFVITKCEIFEDYPQHNGITMCRKQL